MENKNKILGKNKPEIRDYLYNHGIKTRAGNRIHFATVKSKLKFLINPIGRFKGRNFSTTSYLRPFSTKTVNQGISKDIRNVFKYCDSVKSFYFFNDKYWTIIEESELRYKLFHEFEVKTNR
jgi:hypothetical protein